MNVHLFFVCSTKKNQPKESKNLHKHKEISAFIHTSCPFFFFFFLLCVPKKAIFKRGSFRTAPLEWSICTRRQKRQKAIMSESLAPSSVSQPTGIHSSARRAAEGHLVKKNKEKKKPQNSSSPHSSLHICRGTCVWSSPCVFVD